MEKLAQNNPAFLLDVLNGRLAFERTGVKLYDSVIGKIEAQAQPRFLAIVGQLREIRAEEKEHEEWLEAQIRGLGGNPDGKSEMAQLEMEEGRGIETIICDGHSNAVHLLHALLAAELADNAGWDVLVKLADEAGDPAAKIEFAQRMAEEAKHLLFIRELVVRSAETMMLGAERPLPRGFGSVAASKMKKPLLVGGALGAVLLGVGALAASALFLARPKLAPRLRHAL